MQLKPLFFMVLLLAWVAFPLNIAGCGNLAAGTSYTLTADVINSSTNPCFITLGAGVTLNGQGHTVDGIGAGQIVICSASGCGGTGGGALTVKNLKISDYAIPIRTEGVTYSLTDISYTNVSVGAYCILFESVITSAYLNNNSCVSNGMGFYFVYGGNNIVIANSTLNASSGSLIFETNGANVSISNTYANSTILFPAYNTNRIDFTNFTSSNYGNLLAPANRTSEINYTDIVNTSAILFKTYNHDTGARINYANYTITNTTGSSTAYDRYWLMLDKDLYPDASITISNPAGYYDSNIETSASWESGFDSQVLLVPKTASNVGYVNFHVVNSMGTAIQGAVCGAFKTQGTAWYLTGSKKTEATGIASILLQTTTQYKMMCEASGYSTYTFYVTPTEGTYTITLYTSGSGIGFPTDIEGIRTSFNSSLPMEWNITHTLSFTIANTSINSSLDWFAWRIYNGTNLLNSQNDSTHPSGGSLTYTFMPGNTTGIIVEVIFKRVNRGTVDYTFTIPVYFPYAGTGGASLTDALVNIKLAFGDFTIVLIILTVGVMMAGWVGGFSPGAAVAVFLGVLTIGFMIQMTILTGIVLLTSYILAGAYFMLRGGG